MVLTVIFMVLYISSFTESANITSNVTFNYKQNVDLACKLNGTSISFYYIESQKSTQISADKSKYSIDTTSKTLTIKTLRKADISRQYYCTNNAGDFQTFIAQVTPYMYQVDQRTVYSISGGSALISCYMLAGFDTNGLNISWNWTFKDALISSDSKYKFDNKNNYSTVTINSLSLDDSGAYVCQGTNIYGTYKRSVNLFVKSNLTPVWPFIGTLIELAFLVAIIYGVERFSPNGNLYKNRKTKPLDQPSVN